MKILQTNWLYVVLWIIIILVMWCAVSFAEQKMDLTKAVIHHTASGDVSADTIDQWHKERGWDGIGYHFVIRKNGAIETGRPLDKIGAHAKGRNNYVGIVLCGYDDFSKEQITSLISLLKALKIKHIEAHHESCPGKGLDLNYIRKEIQ